MLCKDGGLNEKLGIYTQKDGNNSKWWWFEFNTGPGTAYGTI